MVLKVCQGMRLEVEVQVSVVKDGVGVLVSSDNLSKCLTVPVPCQDWRASSR